MVLYVYCGNSRKLLQVNNLRDYFFNFTYLRYPYYIIHTVSQYNVRDWLVVTLLTCFLVILAKSIPNLLDTHITYIAN